MKKEMKTPVIKLLAAIFLLFPTSLFAGGLTLLSSSADGRGYFEPLEEITLTGVSGETVKVFDGKGIEYFSMPAAPVLRFSVAGNLGGQKVVVYDKKGAEVDCLSFVANAKTKIDDDGRYKEMFDLFYRGMCVYYKDGFATHTYNGKEMSCFVHWGLDQYHTLKGMQYFSPIGNEFFEFSKEHQDDSGFIYTFVMNEALHTPYYYETAYKPFGFFKYIDPSNKGFVGRQPAENHCEYIHVNGVHMVWQSSGDTTWMKSMLQSCARALDYSVTSNLRYSEKYGLLKRAYTIDSWDFQAHDKYLPDLGLTPAMLIDAEKTKFGVFYGDNTGYADACDQLSEMFAIAGDKVNADKFESRAAEIRERLNKLSWNGRFFTHFIEEDPTVVRDFGVDEKSQISHSNCYTVNRGFSPEQNKAIIETYLNLKDNLPKGSPGEWYAIYPPFERGFGPHGAKWQYMNGGIAGHAAGELARGAYENGYEEYATDILVRLHDLGKQTGNDRISFAYTGAYPDPKIPNYTTLDLAKYANMDIVCDNRGKVRNWMDGSEPGTGLVGFPSGRQTFAGRPFLLTDPATNKFASVVAVSNKKGYLKEIEIPVNKMAACVYVVHGGDCKNSVGVYGNLMFVYDDGTTADNYIAHGKQIAQWWFPGIASDYAGVAWSGPDAKAADVGVYWAALDNPYPEKKIKSLKAVSMDDGSIYALMGVTLADEAHYVRPNLQSFGGPDNWSAATAMYALVHGLAGAQDQPGEVAFNAPLIAPRWMSTAAGKVDVTIRYEASGGYVAYSYEYLPKERKMAFDITGNAPNMAFHVLLPKGVTQVKEVRSDGKVLPASYSSIEGSHYVDFSSDINGVQEIEVFLY